MDKHEYREYEQTECGREPWDGSAERQAFATALAAEDRAPKQTEQEAVAAYDDETCQRFMDLVHRKRGQGAITLELARRCGQIVGAIEVSGRYPQQLTVNASFLAAPLSPLPWEAL